MTTHRSITSSMVDDSSSYTEDASEKNNNNNNNNHDNSRNHNSKNDDDHDDDDDDHDDDDDDVVVKHSGRGGILRSSAGNRVSIHQTSTSGGGSRGSRNSQTKRKQEHQQRQQSVKLLSRATEILKEVDDAYIIQERSHVIRRVPTFRPEEISLGKLLGTGGFGIVHEIRKFTLDDSNTQDDDDEEEQEQEKKEENEQGRNNNKQEEDAEEASNDINDDNNNNKVRIKIEGSSDQNNHDATNVEVSTSDSSGGIGAGAGAGVAATATAGAGAEDEHDEHEQHVEVDIDMESSSLHHHKDHIHYEVDKARQMMMKRCIRRRKRTRIIQSKHSNDTDENENDNNRATETSSMIKKKKTTVTKTTSNNSTTTPTPSSASTSEDGQDMDHSGIARYAIKRLHGNLNELERARGMIDLALEAKYLSIVWHPNIVKLRGMAKTDDMVSHNFFIIIDRLYETLDKRMNFWYKHNKICYQRLIQHERRNIIPKIFGCFTKYCCPTSVIRSNGGSSSSSINTTSGGNSSNNNNGKSVTIKSSSSRQQRRKSQQQHQQQDPNDELHDLLVERMTVAYDLAAAFFYLHENRLVYRDIKPENIGFDLRGDVKVFDFGLCKSLSNKLRVRTNDGGSGEDNNHTATYGYKLTGRAGSLPYMAPEVIKMIPYDTKCDVYSFAILLWEILCLQKAWPDVSNTEFVERIVINKERLPIPPGSTTTTTSTTKWPPLTRLMIPEAWDDDPKKRPDMKRVAILIRGDLNDMTTDERVLRRTRHMGERSHHSYHFDDYINDDNIYNEENHSEVV